MGTTLELAALAEAALDYLDDETTETQIATAMFDESEHRYSAGRIWHVIHYVLTGDVEGSKTPESFILSGGRRVGPRKPHGRARVLGPAKCKQIAKVLVDADTFVRRLAESAPLPDEVFYGSHVDPRNPDRDHIAIYVELKAFIEATIARDEGILLDIIG